MKALSGNKAVKGKDIKELSKQRRTLAENSFMSSRKLLYSVLHARRLNRTEFVHKRKVREKLIGGKAEIMLKFSAISKDFST